MFVANPELNALRNARMTAVIAEGVTALAAQLETSPDAVGPRIAATVAAAILFEITDIPQGPDRDEAIDAAVRFLDAGIAALATSDK
ncbi:MAG TPA: hypothetical protein VI365_01145 [Trebonia sp.]